MRFKPLLALLVSAALALSLLAGCCGGKSLSQVIVDLLNGLYSNVSVEADSDLTAALKQAAAEGGTEEEILSRMIEILNLNGGSITFTRLGSGQQGDHAVTLYFQTGTDPDAAARSALAQWASTLGTLPDDGSYQGDVAMIEADNGYYIALDVEVIKAGSRDDESTPVTLKSLSVTGLTTTGYEVGDKFDPVGITVSAVYSDGHSEPLLSTDYIITINGSSPGTDYVFKKAGSYTLKITYKGQELTQTIEVSNNSNGYYESADGSYVVTGSEGLQNLFADNPTSDFAGKTITLDKSIAYTVDTTDGPLAETFKGELQGNDATVTIKGGTQGLFGFNYGTVQDVDIEVTGNISGSGNIGAVAGTNHGTIQNCHVTGGTIENIGTSSNVGIIGGLVGCNYNTIIGCSAAAAVNLKTSGSAGGIAGANYSIPSGNSNQATITACFSTGEVSGNMYNGGVVGYNGGGTVTACYHAVGEVSGGIHNGGVVGQNNRSNVYACYWSGQVSGGNGIGYDDKHNNPTNDNAEQVDSTTVTWETAMDAMNTKLTGENWQYVEGDGSAPLTLKKN